MLEGFTYEPYNEQNIPWLTPDEADEPNLHNKGHDPLKEQEIEERRHRYEPNPLEI